MKAKRPSRLAIVDHLTGLYNRRHFDKCLKKFIAEAKKKKKHFSLLMIDIDKFKDVNDKYGHLVGDTVLNDSAKVLKASVRKPDICFRYGGDEIAVLLPNADRKTSRNIAVRLKSKVEKYKFATKNKLKLRLKLSIGLAVFPTDGQKPEDLIKQADVLLYKVKSKKKTTRKITEPFVLETKLIPPGLKENTISRPKLLSLLKKNFNKKLILIIADAGYGKTTLLLQFLKEEKLPHIFYTLDNNDAELTTFISHFAFALEKLQKDLCARTKNITTQIQDPAKNYEMVMGTLINELLEKRKTELSIILDDYHNIQEKSIVHKAMNYFIEHLPENIKVIISSRTIPRLTSIPRWRSKQDMFEMTRESLKFTNEEIQSLLTEIYQFRLRKEETKRLIENTEGWITGIQLILQTAGRDGKTIKQTLNGYLASNKQLFEYFANDILTSETLKIQDFLKKSSILDIITPDACNNIFNMQRSASLLKHIEKRNLFISVIGTGEYKYHHLFREFLREEIKDKEYRHRLHSKAAKYYQQKGQLEHAIGHYLDAAMYENAVRIIVEVWERLEEQARHATVNSWLQRIPKVVFGKEPRLLIIQGMLRCEEGLFEEAEELYRKADSTLSKRRLKRKDDLIARTNVLSQRSRIFWRKGLYDKTLKFLKKALMACPSSAAKTKGEIFNLMGLSWQELGVFKKAKFYLSKAKNTVKQLNDPYSSVVIDGNLAFLLRKQGETKLAFKQYLSLIERIKGYYHLGIGVLFNNAARNAVDLGQVKWAEQCLDYGWSLCEFYQDPRSRAALHHALGVLYTVKKDWDKASQYLMQAKEEFKKMRWTLMHIVVVLELGHLYRYCRKFDKAQKYLNQALATMNNKKSSLMVSILAELALLEVSRRELGKAAHTIKKCRSQALRFELKREEFCAHLACAELHLLNDRRRKALHWFSRAVHLAKLKGYDGILAREIHRNPHLVELTKECSIEKSYLLSLGLLKNRLDLKIRVQCFGGLQLIDEDGQPLPLVWSTKKAQSLFAFLVANRKVSMHREIFIEQLWPGLPKKRGSKNFRMTASRMRQCLIKAFSGQVPQDRIFVYQHQNKYRLFPEMQLQVDTEEFNHLLKEADRTQSPEEKAKIIRQALDLYRGDYLPEIYDSWTGIPRQRLREQRLSALRWLASYSAQQGDDISCVAACESYLSIDPLSEEIVRLSMKSLGNLGRVKAIKMCYKSLKQALQRELHTVPSQKAQILYHFLLGKNNP